MWKMKRRLFHRDGRRRVYYLRYRSLRHIMIKERLCLNSIGISTSSFVLRLIAGTGWCLIKASYGSTPIGNEVLNYITIRYISMQRQLEKRRTQIEDSVSSSSLLYSAISLIVLMTEIPACISGNVKRRHGIMDPSNKKRNRKRSRWLSDYPRSP